MPYIDFTSQQIDKAMQLAWTAFHTYRLVSLQQRAGFMRAIASELNACSDDLVQTAMRETHLPEARLMGELARTRFQLTNYADACEKGGWLEARISKGDNNKLPARPDIRKMLVPLGPVVIFGASNFPFAFSTAGGDTACAFAAGCPVIIKVHPAHADTSEMVAAAIMRAAEECIMPKGIFTHVHGESFEVGKALVMHPHTKAVGFTGSYTGGKQLFDWGNQRKEPIPVFCEMGSVNPVFLLPEKLNSSAAEIAAQYAASIIQGVGQFCTNPGVIIGLEGEDLKSFINHLSIAIQQAQPAQMLHPGIAKSYNENRQKALAQNEVQLVAEALAGPDEFDGLPTLASASGEAFLKNPVLHKEVFGPYSIIVRCKNIVEMLTVVKNLEGQLTCTIMATDNDVVNNLELVEAIKNICGRFIINGVPTGVEVCLSMQHGGPFPACTDSRFTAVGADGIKRFARPIAFQNWSNQLLPDELKDENPLGIWRTVEE